MAEAAVKNYLQAVIEELEMLAQLIGTTDVKNFEVEDLGALTRDAASITGVKLVGNG